MTRTQLEHAVLPDGWQKRLVRFESRATRGVVAQVAIIDERVRKAVAARIPS